MAAGANEASRARREELWTRWLADGRLDPDERQELVTALAEDAGFREELLADQRIEGALCALGRGSVDDGAFARRFSERVAAERDGRGFVSSFERRMRKAGLAEARRSGWRGPVGWIVASAVAAAALVLIVRRPPPAAPIAQVAPVAYQAPPLLTRVLLPMPVPATPARVERVTGTVVVVDNTRKTPARDGTDLEAGAGLVTVGPDSRAVVAFADHTRIELGGNTALMQIADTRAREAHGKEAFLARGRLSADVAPQPPGRPMLLTTPHAEAMVVGTRFALAVEPQSTRLDVDDGTVELGRLSGGAPVLVRAAEHALVSEANEPALIGSPRGTALLVVGSLMLTPSDERVRRRLETLGFEVHVRGSGPPDGEELRHAAVVLLSSSIFSLDVNTAYRDVAVPIVVWEPSLFDDLGMTGPEENGECGVAASTGEALVRETSHTLGAGLSGLVQLVSPSRDRAGNLRRIWTSFGVPGPHAITVATWPDHPEHAMVFAYERGVPMPGLVAAPARRVGLFLYDRLPPQLTEAGWAVFDAALTWASER